MMANVHAVTLSMIGKRRDELSMPLDDTIAAELRSVLANFMSVVDAQRENPQG